MAEGRWRARQFLRDLKNIWENVRGYWKIVITFAALLETKALGLGYGVMVTQQVLVLFFLVRIRVSQPPHDMR